MSRNLFLGKRRLQQLAKKEYLSSDPSRSESTDSRSNADNNEECEKIIPNITNESQEEEVRTTDDIQNYASTDTENEKNDDILQSLKEWYCENSVNQHQFSTLLKILRQHICFSYFPADCRSLLCLKTPDILPVHRE